MAFRRPPSSFTNALGSPEFPFESDRYILYVSLACPWACGALQVARLRGLVPPLSPSETESKKTYPMKLAVVHQTWQYTDPAADAEACKIGGGLAAGVAVGEPHAGWVFGKQGTTLLPIAVAKNLKMVMGAEAAEALSAACGVNELCSNQQELVATKVPAALLRNHGISNPFCTEDPSQHGCGTLRHLYEKVGGFMRDGVRATTPMVFDTKTDRVVTNDSIELIQALDAWGDEVQGTTDGSLNPEALREQIKASIARVYAVNNGVYRCGFSNSQPAYEEAATELQTGMAEAEQQLGTRRWLVEGSSGPTLADIRLFNTMVRMDEVYVCYFKTGFAGLLAGRYPKLLRHTARVYNHLYPVVADTIQMEDIRTHYFSSHMLRNAFAVVPREIGVVEVLRGMAEDSEKA